VSIQKCPWYNNGVCYSPKTLRKYGEPSEKPVSNICLSPGFSSCEYYSEQKSEEVSLETFEENVVGLKEKSYRLYLPVHTLPASIKSDCPFFETVSIRNEKGDTILVARCKSLRRFLTRSQALKCVNYWRECPFYILAIHRETLV